ncbi:DUF1206 domain-containing protein [Streptomyces sp. GSL17-111]|uniref:DUF1206 domain-containing protein n=1 Tax=Streptomyces sp. GSL17-111 TaxID=3121596 RepID=UPI0030F372F0
MSVGTAARKGRAAARRTAGSSAMDAAARWGLAARGVIYLLVGLLALQIAFGGGGEEADQSGALRQVAEQPFGRVVVWAIGLGLVGMAVWRLAEALFGAAGSGGRKPSRRLVSAARFAVYTVLATSVLLFAAGEKGSGSSDEQSQDLTARALELPAGRWLVGAACLVVVGAGCYIAWKGLKRKFREELKRSAMSRTTRRTVDVLGVAGSVSRGAVFIVAGVFLGRAALASDADQAKGVDQTLRSFADTPAGPWLLVAVSVGLALFGAFSLALARWSRV